MAIWLILSQMSKSETLVKETSNEPNEIQDGEGRYADTFRIGHSAYKFVLEFGQVDLEATGTHFHTRVIIGPDSAKEFFKSFGQTIKEHEAHFGRISHEE